jgi:hypothetical protein
MIQLLNRIHYRYIKMNKPLTIVIIKIFLKCQYFNKILLKLQEKQVNLKKKYQLTIKILHSKITIKIYRVKILMISKNNPQIIIKIYHFHSKNI